MPIENKKLKDHFPMIRDREEILKDINSSPELLTEFNSWNNDQQNLFLDICCGARGAKILYDCFFKEILNPEHNPERLSSLLSELLRKKVTVKAVLPNDSERIGDETSLIITDIVVELEDGSIANVEVQKIGYAFPGERASCYTADLDTGIRLNLLENIMFIPVDIFLNKLHNYGINSNLDAWLCFLGCDEPEIIINLIQKYPQFKAMYSHLYDLCRNIEGVMNMFSKELQLMDQNTVKYMMDELQEELDSTKEQLDTANTTISTLSKENASLLDENASLTEKNARLLKLLDEKGISVSYR